MNPMQSFKIVSVTPPAAKVDDASFTTAAIDTQGYDGCTVLVYLGDTDIAMTALKMQESDTDGSYGDITGLVYGTSVGVGGTASTLPASTDDNKVFAFELDLRGRKRFLNLIATAGNGSTGIYGAVLAILWRGDEAKQDAASRGFANILRVG